MNYRKILRRYFFLAVIIVYIGSLLFHSQLSAQRRSFSPVGLPDQVFGDGFYYLQLTDSLVKGKGMSVFDDVREIGKTLKFTGYSVGSDGKVYITFMPTYSILLVPAYAIAGNLGVYVFNALLGILTCYYIYKLVKHFVGVDTSIKTTLFFAFGTIIYTYSQVAYADVLGALLVAVSAYYAIEYQRTENRKPLLVSSISYSLLLLVKPFYIIISLMFIAYHLHVNRMKSIQYVVLPFSAAIFMMLAYHTIYFGGPLNTPYSSELVKIDGRVQVLDHVGPSLWRNNPLKSVPLMILILVGTQPILAASFMGLWENRGIRDVRFAGLVVLVLSFILGFRYNPLGLLCWSARFLTPVVPLLAVPLALAIENEQVHENMILMLGLASIVLTVFSLAPVSWQLFTQFPLTEMISYNPL